MMTQASTEKNTVLKRISETIDQAMENDSIYQELDRDELIETFSKLLDRVSPQILLPLNDERLKKGLRESWQQSYYRQYLMIVPQKKKKCLMLQ
ncbi:hypothetical protein [Okeania sp. KiyG1]|uniref:hypothetical protein n=1 Tax=Okeania sp. KiyG1 TaxID=2720165 RepID=UPI001923DBF3|nr:hypothetical protein [Okeania sp. KiyG1]GGA44199.1 hypothetical protein CYANOKiyG1_62910 [Okeania sp. KiyG1]